MCTLTIIPVNLARENRAAGGADIRVVCNRDESRLRPAALAPQLRKSGDRTTVTPIDPVSDGTWIAASDAGLVFVLMNVSVARSTQVLHAIESGSALPPNVISPSALPPSTMPTLSRGRIIPHVSRAASLREARSWVESLDHARFEPFRLVMVDRTHCAEYIWAGGEGRFHEQKPIRQPLFFTSSGLGDAVVATPRRQLFDELFAPDRVGVASQDAFHRHAWPGNERASVWMTRDDALTVSRTEVELTFNRVTLSYHARIADSSELIDAEPITLAIASVPDASS